LEVCLSILFKENVSFLFFQMQPFQLLNSQKVEHVIYVIKQSLIV
jgi:hypothetical protein